MLKSVSPIPFAMSTVAKATRRNVTEAAFKEILFKRQMIMYNQYRQLALARYKTQTNITRTRTIVGANVPTVSSSQNNYYKVYFGTPRDAYTSPNEEDKNDATRQAMIRLTNDFYNEMDSDDIVLASTKSENTSVGSTGVKNFIQYALRWECTKYL